MNNSASIRQKENGHHQNKSLCEVEFNNVESTCQNLISDLQSNLTKLEIKQFHTQNLIQDKDKLIKNLENQVKLLQNELLETYSYIEYINNPNTHLDKESTGVISKLRKLLNKQIYQTTPSVRNINFKQLFTSLKQFPITVSIDSPKNGDNIFIILSISGWATATATDIFRVEVFLDGIKLDDISFSDNSSDILAATPWQKTANYSFSRTLNLDKTLLGTGAKTLKIKITDTKGNQQDSEHSVVVQKDAEFLSRKIKKYLLNRYINTLFKVHNKFSDIVNSYFNRFSALKKPSENGTQDTIGILKGFRNRVLDHLQANLYLNWIIQNEPNSAELIIQRKTSAKWKYRPLFSLIAPIYNTSPELLEATLNSVVNQTYENWELCLVDCSSDSSKTHEIISKYAKQYSRIRVKFLETDPGLAGNFNETIRMARGEFIALLDISGELAPNALYENALLLNQHSKVDMIYSDEDKLNLQGFRCNPYFKPDWSPDLFHSTMYTSHLGVYRRSLINKIGGFREGFEGDQNYDLVLRLIEQTDQIYHIPKILYHWRKTEVSTNSNQNSKSQFNNAQIKAVSEHFQRANIDAEVTKGLADNLLRVKRKLINKPKVSIIIPTKDHLELLEPCLGSIQKLTDYSNYEIIVVDNNSSEPKTLKYLDEISAQAEVRVIKYPHPFNFSALNNFAVKQADGELLLFLNNDTKIISNEWLEAMVEHAVRPEVGAVGAKLLYANNTIQHAGVIIGIGGVAGHSHKHFSNDHSGYFNRANAVQNVSAVTGACLMIKKEVFEALGGFNEKNLAIAYNDIDLCLRLRQKDLLIIYTPYAKLYHYESRSRGYEQTPQKLLRFQNEKEYMLACWKKTLENDPYYNPNLTLEREDFSITTAIRQINNR